MEFQTFRAQRETWNRIPKSGDKTARIHRCGPMLFCYRIENSSLKYRELKPADISRERCPCRHGRGAGRNKKAADGREEVHAFDIAKFRSARGNGVERRIRRQCPGSRLSRTSD